MKNVNHHLLDPAGGVPAPDTAASYQGILGWIDHAATRCEVHDSASDPLVATSPSCKQHLPLLPPSFCPSPALFLRLPSPVAPEGTKDVLYLCYLRTYLPVPARNRDDRFNNRLDSFRVLERRGDGFLRTDHSCTAV